MADLLERLKTALSDRYRIERELGAGGMATVYLAEDLKHHRKVAVKVLRPELAAVLGAERFDCSTCLDRPLQVAGQNDPKLATLLSPQLDHHQKSLRLDLRQIRGFSRVGFEVVELKLGLGEGRL